MASTGFLARLGEVLLCNGLLPGTDFPAREPKPQLTQANVKSERHDGHKHGLPKGSN